MKLNVTQVNKRKFTFTQITEEYDMIGIGISTVFRKRGISWSSYWLTREPSGIAVIITSDTTATVTWTDSAVLGADGYKVYAGATLKATVAVGVQTAAITGLTANTTYVFKVVAYKGTNESTGITASATTLMLGDGNTVAWFDYTDTSTLTLSGALVTKWADKLGSGRDLLQADTNKSPTLNATGISFGGTDEYMKCSAFTLIQPEYIYLVLKNNAALTSKSIMDGNAANKALLTVTGAGTVRHFNGYAGTFSPNNNGLIFGQYNIVRYFINGASSKLQVNGETAVTWNAGTNTMGGFTLGCRGDIAQYANCEVKEVIIRKVADNTADETTIYNYLNTKYFSWVNMTENITLSCAAVGAGTNHEFKIAGYNALTPVVINYGDGSREYLTMDGTDQTLSHEFPAAGTYTVTIGNASNISSLRCLVGRYYSNLSTLSGAANLELLAVGNASGSYPWIGDIVNLAAGLKYLYLGEYNTISGDISRFTELLALDMVSSATNDNTITGSIEGCTKLKWFMPWGLNTIYGDMSHITTLENVYVGGTCAVTMDVTNLINVCSLEKASLSIDGTTASFSGSIANLTKIGTSNNNPITGVAKPGWLCVAEPNTLSGSINGLVDAIYLSATGLNTITGDISGLIKLQFIGLGGNANITGSITNLVDLEVLTANATFTRPATVVNNTKLIYLASGFSYTVTEVNQILADFWANKDQPKPELTYSGRIISLVNSSSAPTGQGLLDKAALQAYRSPNNDAGEPLWTVNTN